MDAILSALGLAQLDEARVMEPNLVAQEFVLALEPTTGTIILMATLCPYEDIVITARVGGALRTAIFLPTVMN